MVLAVDTNSIRAFPTIGVINNTAAYTGYFDDMLFVDGADGFLYRVISSTDGTRANTTLSRVNDVPFASTLEVIAGTESNKGVSPLELFNELARRLTPVFDLLGISEGDANWSVFTGATLTDNATSLRSLVQELETALETLSVIGTYVGPSSTTYAGLVDATTVDVGDITALTEQDGTNPRGIYISNGTSWDLLIETGAISLERPPGRA